MNVFDAETNFSSPAAGVVREIVGQVAQTLEEAEELGRPLELDPFRDRLFQLFVTAEATGFVQEGGQFDLTCDGIARELGNRWNLGRNEQGEAVPPQALAPEQVKRLKLVWSFMRLWNEWAYAWQRWGEFHGAGVKKGG